MPALICQRLDNPEEVRTFAGRMQVVMADGGEEMEYGPGDFAIMPPGHDASILGDQPCIVIDWQGFADYAKPP